MKVECPICHGEYGRTYEEHTGSEKHREAVRRYARGDERRLNYCAPDRALDAARPASPDAERLDVERLVRAHEDIVTMYAHHEPGWDVVHEWHQDPGDIFKARAAIKAILDRAREYDGTHVRYDGTLVRLEPVR